MFDLKCTSISLLWLCNCIYTDGTTLNPHCHEYYQIHLARQGKASFCLDGEAVELTQNMAVLIKPGTMHGITKVESVDDAPFGMYEIKFAVDNAQFVELLNRIPERLIADAETMALFDYIFSEGKNQGEFYEEVMTHLLCAILYKWSQKESINSGNISSYSVYANQAQLVEKVKNFIALNYVQQISLDDIANSVGCNKTYLCRVYRNHTGSTINAHLNSVRIKKATELLFQTDTEIEKIAASVGYNNVYHFIKTFKKIMKISPGNYRRQSINGSNLVENHHINYECIYVKVGVVDAGILE